MAYQLKPVGRIGQNGEIELFPSMAGSLQSGTRNITTPPAEAMIPQRQLSTPEMVDNRPGVIQDSQLNPWDERFDATPPPSPLSGFGRPRFAPKELAPDVPDTPETPSGTAGPNAPNSPFGPPSSLLGSRREVKAPTLIDPRERPEFDPNQRGREKAALVGGALGLLGGGLGGAAQGATAGMGAFDKTRQADYQQRVGQVDAYNKAAGDYNTRLTDRYGKELTAANNEFATRQRDRAAEIGADSRLEVAQLLAESREREGNANRKLDLQKLEKDLLEIDYRNERERADILARLDKEIFNLTSTMASEQAQTLWLNRNALAAQLGMPPFTQIPGTRLPNGQVVPPPGMTPEGLRATTDSNALKELSGYRTGMLDVAKTNAATNQREADIRQQEANNKGAGVGYYQRGGGNDYKSTDPAVDPATGQPVLRSDGKYGNYTLAQRTKLLEELQGAGAKRAKAKAELGLRPSGPPSEELTRKQQKWDAKNAALGMEDTQWTAFRLNLAKGMGLENVNGQWYLLEQVPPKQAPMGPLNLPGVSPEKARDVMGSTLDLQGDGGLSGGSSLLNLGPQPAGQPLQITLPGGGTATARPTGGRSSRPPSTQDPKYRKPNGGIDYPKWKKAYDDWEKGQKPAAKPTSKPAAKQASLPKGVKRRADGSYDLSGVSEAELQRIMTTGK